MASTDDSPKRARRSLAAVENQPAEISESAEGHVWCIRCRTSVAPSQTGPGVPACGLRRCRETAAQSDVVIALLSRLPDWSTAIDVTTASDGIKSSWTIGRILLGLDKAGLAESRTRAAQSRQGGRQPLVYRLTGSGRETATSLARAAEATTAATGGHKGAALLEDGPLGGDGQVIEHGEGRSRPRTWWIEIDTAA